MEVRRLRTLARSIKEKEKQLKNTKPKHCQIWR